MSDIEKLGAYLDTLREMSHFLLKQTVRVCMMYDKLFDNPSTPSDYVDDKLS